MIKIITEVENYLLEVLGVTIQIDLWEKEDGLPFFLSDRYDFYTCILVNRQYLLVTVKDDSECTPATLKKHSELIEQYSNMSSIYILSAIPSYNRKRLIQHHVSFIVPNNQLYTSLRLESTLENIFERQKRPKTALAQQHKQ